jgi:hypothetical protein
MTERTAPNVEVVDLAPGLWIWRLEHPGWHEGADWQEVVTSVCVDAGGERWLLDPLLPPPADRPVWDRFAERAPTAVALVIPDHSRPAWDDPRTSLDVAVDLFDCRAFGPDDWSDNEPPKTALKKIVPGEELPGGLLPFRDPRGWSETPLYLPEHRTLVFGDALTERAGTLRVWSSPTHRERAIPDLRAMLDRGFERLVISHGEPVHGPEALERALELPAWPITTPLHRAAWNGDFDLARSLVEEGADVAALDEAYGATPVQWAEWRAHQEPAAGRGHQRVIEYLRSRLADSSR